MSENKRIPCLDVDLPSQVSQDLAEQENRNNRPAHLSMIAAMRRRCWAPGRILHIAFLNGDKSLHQIVRTHAATWLDTANIHFEFVGSDADLAQTEIRISLKEGRGNWSCIGTDALEGQFVGRPTMNLDIEQTTDEEQQRIILHEFGHVLGCVHEHQNPNAQEAFPWNETAVYSYFRRFGWDDNRIMQNILQRYTRAMFNNPSQYDPDSIMSYYVPESLLAADAQLPPYNTTLSELDKKFMRFWYP